MQETQDGEPFADLHGVQHAFQEQLPEMPSSFGAGTGPGRFQNREDLPLVRRRKALGQLAARASSYREAETTAAAPTGIAVKRMLHAALQAFHFPIVGEMMLRAGGGREFPTRPMATPESTRASVT